MLDTCSLNIFEGQELAWTCNGMNQAVEEKVNLQKVKKEEIQGQPVGEEIVMLYPRLFCYITLNVNIFLLLTCVQTSVIL